MGQKLKILFINAPEEKCSIWNSGIMVYQALKLSDAYALDYMELRQEKPEIPAGYSVYLFNYHPANFGWLKMSSIRKLPGLKATVVLEVLPDDPFPLVSPIWFDVYLVLDPTCRHRNPKVFSCSRPLDLISPTVTYVEPPVPVIGTFGFGVFGKGIDKVVEAVRREFDRAVVRVNIPFNTFSSPDIQRQMSELEEQCAVIAGKGIEVRFTHDYMSKQALVDWCTANTLNCFMYTRDMPGLSATTDQAVLSGRPLAVSANQTFRHIHQYILPYPERGLRESIAKSGAEVARIQDAWAPASFAHRFNEVLRILAPVPVACAQSASPFLLMPKTRSDRICERIFGIFRRVPKRWWKRYILHEKAWQRFDACAEVRKRGE